MVDRYGLIGARISVNEQLAEKLHKLVIKKSKRRKVYARFKDNIWVANLAEMVSLSSKNKKCWILVICHRCFQCFHWTAKWI